MLRVTRAVAACLIALAGAGCMTSQPFIDEGDANHAEVDYSGDVAAATAVAQRHCAEFNRVARYTGSSGDHAYFACEAR